MWAKAKRWQGAKSSAPIVQSYDLNNSEPKPDLLLEAWVSCNSLSIIINIGGPPFTDTDGLCFALSLLKKAVGLFK